MPPSARADAISDGEHVFVPAVMEHIELAGIHSGDSACIVPSMTIPEKACSHHQRVYQEDGQGIGRQRTYEHAVRHCR